MPTTKLVEMAANRLAHLPLAAIADHSLADAPIDGHGKPTGLAFRLAAVED